MDAAALPSLSRTINNPSQQGKHSRWKQQLKHSQQPAVNTSDQDQHLMPGFFPVQPGPTAAEQDGTDLGILNSRPLQFDIESDAGSEIASLSSIPASPGAGMNLSHAATFSQLPPPASSRQLPHSTSTSALSNNRHQQPHSTTRDHHSTSMALQPVLPTEMALAARTNSLPTDPTANMAKFRNDLMCARMGNSTLDRYKSFVKLFNSLKRDKDTQMVDLSKPDTWCNSDQNAHRLDLLCRIVEVGEALAIFGTAEFGERSNSTRAISLKDYAYLLKAYGAEFWPLFKDEFVEAMPQALQDDMITVRGLLSTRFEANAIIQEQLLKHVGLEGQGQGAVVYNTSVVSANPVNRVYSKPLTTVQTYATAAAKAFQKNQNRYGAMALGAVAGLFLLKRTGMLGFIPGMGRPRRRQPSYESEDEDDIPIARGRRRTRSIGGDRLSQEERLLLAFDHVDRSYKELVKAQQDIDLLHKDWRLGPVRLSAPLGGPHPPGFQQLDLSACEPRLFMHSQLGMPQLAMAPHLGKSL